MKQYIINLHLPVGVIFQIFKAYSNVLNEKLDETSVILFEIYKLSQKIEIESILQKHTGSFSGRRLITNKLKPLKVIAKYHCIDKWSIRIFQENSRSIILSISFDINDIDSELLSILYSFNNRLRDDQLRKELIQNHRRDLNDFEKGVFFLDNFSLEALSKRKKLTLFEKNQILFTYYHYASLYDKNVERIDDAEQRKIAIELNSKVKPILDELIELIIANSITYRKDG